MTGNRFGEETSVKRSEKEQIMMEEKQFEAKYDSEIFPGSNNHTINI
jgi:hypothetical protein